ncbi:MAG TPA: DUF5050 domain-containing protein, partial [Anaerolineaceae bacterium]|nr:DUF5050 domain-containing protein [Anaerolineaceae bacterium]
VYTINVIGSELYLAFYLDIEGNKSDYLSMVKTDRSGSGKFATESSEHIFLVGDGWVYYLNLNDNNMLYKIRTDGSDIQKVQ